MIIPSKIYPYREYIVEREEVLRVRDSSRGYPFAWCVGPRDVIPFTVDQKGMEWGPERARLLAWYAEHAEWILESVANKDRW